MNGQVFPPGLRFPNGSVVNGRFVVSGTHLTSSKHEYALWSLDLKTLVWSRIEAGGSILGQGSWNRGILWPRRNTFLILGHRRRNLVEDYNHRRINFSHVCMVELEAFGLYDNPRRTAPGSGYVSYSVPSVPASLQHSFSQMSLGGRPMSKAADHLGKIAMALPEFADMELQAVGGERLSVSSRVLSRRWGPYFGQLLSGSVDGAVSSASSSTPFLREPNAGVYTTQRASSITITPTVNGLSRQSPGNFEPPSAENVLPTLRPRLLYLPHTCLTLEALVHYFYTASLPAPGSSLCTPQILCSLLQIARPYQVDGLLEATVERLHEVLDGRNAAAVFNAGAMAAGGGRSTGFTDLRNGQQQTPYGFHKSSEFTEGNARKHDTVNSGSPDKRQGSITSSDSGSGAGSSSETSSSREGYIPLKIDTEVSNQYRSGGRSIERSERGEQSEDSRPTSPSTTTSETQSESEASGIERPSRLHHRSDIEEQEIWTGELSSVIGLQKRGLRGLMEGRRLRERGTKPGSTGSSITEAGSSLHQSQNSFDEQSSSVSNDG